MDKIDSLFSDVGKKIKTYTKYLFILDAIGSLVIAYVFGRDRWGDFNFLSFLFILFISVVLSYFTCLFLYGFGEIIDNTYYINSKLNRITTKIEENKTE